MGALLLAVLLVGCSSGGDTSEGEEAGAAPGPTSESTELVLGEDALPPSIAELQYVDLMGQVGVTEEGLIGARGAAQRNCEAFTTEAQYAESFAKGSDIYDDDSVMIEGLGVRRYCEDNLVLFSGGAAVFQTVRDNLAGHCAIPVAERVAALGPEYYPFTAIMCAKA